MNQVCSVYAGINCRTGSIPDYTLCRNPCSTLPRQSLTLWPNHGALQAVKAIIACVQIWLNEPFGSKFTQVKWLSCHFSNPWTSSVGSLYALASMPAAHEQPPPSLFNMRGRKLDVAWVCYKHGTRNNLLSGPGPTTYIAAAAAWQQLIEAWMMLEPPLPVILFALGRLIVYWQKKTIA